MEEWKPIEDYDGIYEVSNFSRVKSLANDKKRKEKILKQRLIGPNRRKYYSVALWNDGKRKTCKVHRLAAMAFIPNPDNKDQVNHIDNNPLNNHISNLEWMTRRENISHGMTFKKTSSKYTGVYWDKRRNKWMSYIKVNGKSKNLGRFADELEAAEAYQTALRSLEEITTGA